MRRARADSVITVARNNRGGSRRGGFRGCGRGVGFRESRRVFGKLESGLTIDDSLGLGG